MQIKDTNKKIKSKLPTDLQIHIRVPRELHKDIVMANSSDSLKSGIKKSFNTTVVELLTKAIKK